MPCLMACLKKTGTFFFLCSIMPMPAFGQRVLIADASLGCTVLLARGPEGSLSQRLTNAHVLSLRRLQPHAGREITSHCMQKSAGNTASFRCQKKSLMSPMDAILSGSIVLREQGE